VEVDMVMDLPQWDDYRSNTITSSGKAVAALSKEEDSMMP